MPTHYNTNIELVANLEPPAQEFWLKILDDLDRQEENYQRKVRYHEVSSLDFVVSEDGRETTLQELIASDSYSGEDYVIGQIEEHLFQEAFSELDMKHRVVFKAMYEDGLKAIKACQFIGCSDKTAKKYYLEACQYILKKVRS